MEKPYCKFLCEDSAEAVIFQIGSSDPELAVKAAQTVQQDVSGM
jgi:tRNA-dihydrouridine synthase